MNLNPPFYSSDPNRPVWSSTFDYVTGKVTDTSNAAALAANDRNNFIRSQRVHATILDNLRSALVGQGVTDETLDKFAAQLTGAVLDVIR